MNKIQITKANTTLRRFFNRMGGGGVKALGYKETASTSGGEGGQSSGEAQALFDAMFGQTPYVNIDESTVVPLSEFILSYLPSMELEKDTILPFLYKEKQPIPKAVEYSVYPTDNESFLTFCETNNTMVQVEEGPDGPWYTPYYADVDLTSFPLPTEETPTVTLTGVAIPDKDTVVCVASGPEVFEASKYSDSIYNATDAGYTFEKIGGVWTWSIMQY